MNKIVAATIAVVFLTTACSKGGGVKLKSDTDSVAYVIGMNVGMNLIKMDSTLNANAVCEGIRDAFRKQTKLSMDDARQFYLNYVNYAIPEKVRAYEEQFLQDVMNSNRSYARTTSGLTYTVGEVGDEQIMPSSEKDSIAVRYVIKTSDGQELYSSYSKNDTIRVALEKATLGLRESVRLIGKGGKIDVWMPAATAYGVEGDAKLGVKPNATLFYQIELVDVYKYSLSRNRESTFRGAF